MSKPLKKAIVTPESDGIVRHHEVMRAGPDHPEYQYFRDTRDHIVAVQEAIQGGIVYNLVQRSMRHDKSKMHLPERAGFMQMAEELKLADTEYGSDEYRAILRKYKDSTIGHHYAANDHHPEHHVGGYASMNLLQKLEMLADWYAATKRMKNGDLRQSIIKNAERFGYDDAETCSLIDTARELGWITNGTGVSDVLDTDAGTAEPGVESE